MKTLVLTGASSGLGAKAAAVIAEQGWQIAVVGRNSDRTHRVADLVGGEAFLADYDRLGDVRTLAAALLERYPVIDVLANNAGGLVGTRGVTFDGFERTFQHNHLAPFLLTNLLLERLEQSSARVVSTSSVMNRVGVVRLDDLQWKKRAWMGGWKAYGTSKLETILFMRELAKRSSVEAFSFHPGYVNTGFGADSGLMRLTTKLRPGGFGITSDEGAVPLIRLVTEETVDVANGTYFDQLAANGPTAKQATDDVLAAELWERSAQLVGL
ncbi:MAG: SDR family NAD(P)-dependent oxidoreductase [Microbacteriaceae bacterium]